MELTIKQTNQDVTLLIAKLMKDNKTNLSKICRTNNMDYTKTYRKIISENISLIFLEKIVELIGDGAQVRSQFFLSLEDKNGQLIEATTLKRNGGISKSPTEPI